MWWLVIPAVGLLGKAIYKAVTDEDDAPKPREKTTLELNFQRLKEQLKSRSGYKVAILGQPGAGKSSLLKKMTNEKVRPLPVIGVQTDATDWSRDSNCNLLSTYENYVFADVPGYDTTSHPLDLFSSFFPFEHFDAYIFVIHGKLHSSDETIFRLVARSGKSISVAKSFAESLERENFEIVERDIRARLLLPKSTAVRFFSNRTGDGVESVFNSIHAKI
jgi:predicted GTPase